MAYFADDQEAAKYLAGMFRSAADHPEVGPKLKAADIDMRVVYTDPEWEMTVRMHDPMEVIEGPTEGDPDITLSMPCDIADKYWRGEYNLAVGLAKGQVKSKGPVNKVLKLVPLTKPLFPIYRESVQEKDQAAA
jgi:hypothetical protein